MKRLGILGGMSWESTALYYKWVNEGVKEKLGGLHSADILLRSVDFQQIETWQAQGDWDSAAAYLAECGADLAKGGAEGLIIATNTMHKVAQPIVERSGLPLLHIADCTGRVIQRQGLTRVALLGTAFTMEQDFYVGRLRERFGLKVMIPDSDERKDVHDIIYGELCLGTIRSASQKRYVEIAQNMQARGAQAVILGCTEIGMLLTEEVTDVPLIDTTRVHAQEAIAWMLSESEG